MNTSRGFTIVELMISIMILAILAFAAAPAMNELIQRNKLKVLSTDMMRSIVAARSEAIARNQPVVLCSSNDGVSCSTGGWDAGWISFADVDDDTVLDVGEEVFSVYQDTDRSTIRSAATNPNLLAFNSNATLEEIVNFRVCGRDANVDRGYSVSVSVTGRPRSEKGVSQCP